jgi:hypothetical protein
MEPTTVPTADIQLDLFFSLAPAIKQASKP